MFKTIWDSIRNYFVPIERTSVATQRDISMEKYRTLANKISSARSLAQLLDTRKELRAFQQHLIEHNLELWGRQLVIDLNRFWTAKFEYWKKKTRSY